MSEPESAAADDEGWFRPPDATRRHYFAPDGWSLCNRWFVLTTLWPIIMERGNDDAPGNCAACRRRLKKGEG